MYRRKVETFSFVSTLSHGSRRFGYCRRFISKDKSVHPTCYCLLSFCSSFSLFSQVLDIVELKLNEGNNSIYTFLHSVLAQPFPDPGETVIAQTFTIVKKEDGVEDCNPETYRLTRTSSPYEYLEHVTFNTLFSRLDVNNMLLIFHALLLELRILVASESLSTLSSCINAISHMCYPFSWQYVFIPILPSSMISFVAAPMPFLMGVLSSSLEKISETEIEEDVLIVDLDKNQVLRQPSNLPDILPPTLTQSLAKVLRLIKESGLTGVEFNIPVSHAFIRFFSGIFGNYAKYIRATDNNEYKFDEEKFLKNKSNEIKRFFNEFKQTQQYQCFIDERETWFKKDIIHYCALLNVAKEDLKKKIYNKIGRKKNNFKNLLLLRSTDK